MRLLLLVALLLAGGYPLLPFVVGDQRQDDQSEDDDAECNFHGWKQDRTRGPVEASKSGPHVMQCIEVASSNVIGFVFFSKDARA